MNRAVIVRLVQVFRVLLQHRVLHLIFALNPQQGRMAQWARRLFPRARDMDEAQEARALRAALEALGPIFIKLGQVLSTRPDVLPAAYVFELAHLQDRVTPVPAEQMCAVIEAELGSPVENLFSEFEYQNVATASIAQVHRARVRSGAWAGREVAVKVLRPDIRPLIDVDVQCMYVAARFFAKNHVDGKRLKPVEVVAQVERHLYQELDLQCEAANASQLGHNMHESKLIFVPEVCWDLNARGVMVMEWMHGIPVSHTAALREKSVDLKRLARDGVEVFFTQVFRDGFFHADMHPGNVFIGTQGVQAGHYIALDCGIVGSLSDTDRYYLAINFLAFFNRDYQGVAKAHIESGWVPRETPLEALTSTVRTVCEPYFGRPISEISLGQVLMRLFDVSREFNVAVQPQLVLLQKTLLNIEGMGRVLDPDLDLWQTAKPFLERWMKETLGPKGVWRQFKRELPFVARHAPQLPRMMIEWLHHAEQFSRNQSAVAATGSVESNMSHRSRGRWSVVWGLLLAFCAGGGVVLGVFKVLYMH